MTDLQDINPHLALAYSESYTSPMERAWERWVQQCEKLLGHSLDGDQTTGGYSLDEAHDAFMADVTPAEYVAEITTTQPA